MRRLESYPTFPGHCQICQTGVTPLIDLQRDFDTFYVGAYYICHQCVSTMAQLLDWVHVDRYNEKADEVNALEDRVDALTADLARVEAENANIRALLKNQLTETPEITAPAKRHPGRPRKVQG